MTAPVVVDQRQDSGTIHLGQPCPRCSLGKAGKSLVGRLLAAGSSAASVLETPGVE